MSTSNRILVTGAGGFIGGHLVNRLLNVEGHQVTAVDIKPLDQWFQLFESANNRVLDLQLLDQCRDAVSDCTIIYNLAADMGGMGFIENNKALCMRSVLINTHLLQAAHELEIKNYLFASSACVYAHDKQTSPNNPGLIESDAYPAMPEDGYGWEKLFSEHMCRHYLEDYGIHTKVARFHNVYGSNGSWDGGREKAPAAICRKVIHSVLSGDNTIEIWGDGKQTRSFTYIDDCIEGILLLAKSSINTPINIGSSEMVTIDHLVDLVEQVARIKLIRTYNLDAPKGVRGRSSDNTLILKHLHWEPGTRLCDGLTHTYNWIFEQMKLK